jgi:hypothetical protein
MKAPEQVVLLFHDGCQKMDADSNLALAFDGIGRCAIERLDSQMLLDPPEE